MRIRNILRAARDLMRAIVSPQHAVQYFEPSYSQEGEDMILKRIFETLGRTNGFYVDVGAHHPQIFSNTYYFYRRGWRGINIDAMPDSMDLFRQRRPLDVNLEMVIADSRRCLTYHAFKEPALNTFSKPLAERYRRQSELLFEREMSAMPLAEILDQHLPPGQSIDFLNIDVEGLDYEVLVSNNWSKYRPNIILIEELERITLDRLNESRCYQFLRNQRYALFAMTLNTLIFKKQD